MNKVIFVAVLVAAVGSANAQSFYDSVFTMSHPTATSVETALGRNIRRDLTDFSLGAGEAQTTAWTYKLNASPGGWNGVNLTIKGDSTAGAVVKLVGTEEVFDISGGSSVSVGSGLVDYDGPSGTGGGWTAHLFIPFSGNVNNGFVSKDILFVNLGSGTMVVHDIEQSFVPVPEPASMIALGLGAAALLRRRK